MFQNDELKNHLQESSVIRTQSAVIAEWNMNIPENIKKIGNYRYRPTQDNSIYKNIISSFNNDEDKDTQVPFYYAATDADVVIDGGVDNIDEPTLLTSKKEYLKLIYSLEDCFYKFRPRSGINKASYFSNSYIHNANSEMANRPRYYMPDKGDYFKYWTSFRTEGGLEYGVANKTLNGQHHIEDVAPFIVYKNKVPTNRVVVKMQTHVGSVDLGPFSTSSKSFSDPFYGDANSKTPIRWKIQALKNNNWIDIKKIDSNTKRKNGTPIIGSDGYVELGYGLIVPDKYQDIFIKAEDHSSTVTLPESSINGYAYLVKENENALGLYYIWVLDKYETFVPTYGWQINEETVDRLTNFVTDTTSPIKYLNSSDGLYTYREFDYIEGLRVIVETMNRPDSTFDLIELSPRLVVDLSEKTTEFSVTKTASDLGSSGLPVGQLLASNGTLRLFDYDQAFNTNNDNSIIKNYITKNIQIKFYEVIINVDGYDYFVPIKTMYTEGFPETNNESRQVSLKLRDLFFYLESINAPQLLVTSVSLSYAISVLLDSVGFSNYSFKRVSGENDPVIPYFFIPPDTSVAQILNQLAISTQTAMFFDEYNNFIMMSKNYILPKESERQTDFEFYGTKDFIQDGLINNKKTNAKLANIISINSQNNDVFNDGSINYKTRYIQKTYGSIKQASLIDSEKTWIYKPVLLWEVTGDENTKSINDQSNNQSNYVLGAIPLNSDLSETVPSVYNNVVINNTIDLGEGIYWLSRYSGYFYANGEIIKYDAVQYTVSGVGNVWITSTREYQNYFSKLNHNGKIYPTGLIRIFSYPNYQTIDGITKLKNGLVAKHGRGQFGTKIVGHYAGLNSYWSDNANVRGCSMRSELLFSLAGQNSIDTKTEKLILDTNAAGVNNNLATQSTRSGIIKNFLSQYYGTETDFNKLKTTQTGTIQSSAFILNGPSFTTTQKGIDFISYVHKPLKDSFKHFGTRMRIIGKIENNQNRGQTPIGSDTYFVVTGNSPEQNINISAGSGGLAVMLNPTTNVGYYFEILALTENNVSSYSKSAENLHNIIFYKILRDTATSDAIPVKLWGGLANVIVDDGKFTGQYRMVGEENPTVYDLAVEYQNIGNIRRFYLYINNRLVSTVDDDAPLPMYNNMAIFTRGSARCMFENIYALTNNYSQNTVFALDTPVMSAINDSEINANESFRKYAMSGIVQSTYLSGINPSQPPQYNIYFEEFGTIMREASYFNIRYDKAYPALYAKLSPTFNKIKGYTVSGFRAGSYGAEFLIFNATDTALSLDETTGNYLRIQGITFTQESQHQLTMDEYFAKNSSFSNPQLSGSNLIKSPVKYDNDYEDIKISRITYGKKDFSLEAPYIQTQDDANNLMEWIVNKVVKPRKSVSLKVFATPTVQLGDIVTIDYKDKDSVNQISENNARFVVYNIEYAKNSEGPDMTVYLSEV
jgi:hypothetical protein